MSKAPAFQFYPSDWMRDTRQLSLMARGAWADLLCAMWWAQDRGTITRDIDGFSRELACTPDEAEKVIIELIEAGVLDAQIDGESVTPSVTRNGKVTLRHKKVTLISRRMVRDHKNRKLNAERQARHRSNAKSNGEVTPLSSSSSSSSSSSASSNVTFMDRDIAEELEKVIGKESLEKAVEYCVNRGVKKPMPYITGCLKNGSMPWDDVKHLSKSKLKAQAKSERVPAFKEHGPDKYEARCDGVLQQIFPDQKKEGAA